MKTYQTFVFESYKLDEITSQLTLNYSLDQKEFFSEIITLPPFSTANLDLSELESALFALHLIGGVSYFKTYCPSKISIKSGSLTKDQAEFWNNVYQKGLGEFFFQNNFDFRELIHFPAEATSSVPPKTIAPKSISDLKLLVPYGGGKDSIVTTKLLKQQNLSLTLFRMGTHPVIDQLVKTAELPLITVERTLSPRLFELNKEDALNGHVPVTVYLSFLTIVVSLLYGFDAVVMSNERSASYGNVTFHGMEINHQWSKSLESELALQNYIQTYITNQVQYLNLLRPLSELHIAKIFTQYPYYFSQFTSCNTNWRILNKDREATGLWCGHCPKCAFIFSQLAAFLPLETVTELFGKNLYNDPGLLPLYRQLLGIEGFKPFECVGTPEETIAAFYLATQKDEYSNTLAGDLFKKEVLSTLDNPEELVHSLLTPEENYPILSLVSELIHNSRL